MIKYLISIVLLLNFHKILGFKLLPNPATHFSAFSIFSKLNLNVTPKSISDKENNLIDSLKKMNDWFPIAVEASLDKERPHKLSLQGEDIVLWCSGGAENDRIERKGHNDLKKVFWSAFKDSCPHRAVPLSEGRIERVKTRTGSNSVLMCAYHGWTFNPNGKCQNIPQLPKNPPKPLKNNKTLTDSIALVNNDITDRKKKNEKNEKILNSSFSCAKVYPLRKNIGLLWSKNMDFANPHQEEINPFDEIDFENEFEWVYLDLALNYSTVIQEIKRYYQEQDVTIITPYLLKIRSTSSSSSNSTKLFFISPTSDSGSRVFHSYLKDSLNRNKPEKSHTKKITSFLNSKIGLKLFKHYFQLQKLKKELKNIFSFPRNENKEIIIKNIFSTKQKIRVLDPTHVDSCFICQKALKTTKGVRTLLILVFIFGFLRGKIVGFHTLLKGFGRKFVVFSLLCSILKLNELINSFYYES